MNSKSTWVWLALAATLFAAAVGVEKFGRKPPPALVPLLPDFKAADITSIQFAPAGQLEIRAERTNGTWQLIKPVPYPGQNISIDSLLLSLQQLAPAHIIPAAEVRQRKGADTEFGFDKRTTLTLSTSEGSRQLVIGGLTALGDQLYVQIVGTEGVFVVDARLLQLLPGKPEDWRDTGLVDFGHLVFDRIAVSNAATVLQLQQLSSNTLWRLTYPIAARADNLRLVDLLQRLHAMRVVNFITDNPRGDLETYGLAAPELEISFNKGTNLLTNLQFGKSPTNDSTLIYARRSGFSTILTVERQALEPWLAPLDKFRDPHLITRQRSVEQINFQGVENFVLRRTSSNTWQIVDSPLPIDASSVGQMLITLVTAPIVEFKDSITEADLAQYGLDTPTRQLILRGKATTTATNEVVAELAFGNSQNGVVYVRRADENPVYAIRLEDFARLAVAPWQLRERRPWQFSETNLVSLAVHQAGGRIEVRRLGLNSWNFAPGSQGILKSGAAVEETAHRLGELQALAWVDHGADQAAGLGFNTNSLAVTAVLKDGTSHTVEFGGQTIDGYPIAAVEIDGEPWFFECDKVILELLQYALPLPATNP